MHKMFGKPNFVPIKIAVDGYFIFYHILNVEKLNVIKNGIKFGGLSESFTFFLLFFAKLWGALRTRRAFDPCVDRLV